MSCEAHTNCQQTKQIILPEGWKTRKIGDLVEINELSINRDFNFSEIEYINISSVDQGFIKTRQLLKLTDAPSRAKRIVKDKDIIISTVRPNLKHFAFMKNVKPNTIVSTGFAVVSAKKVNPRFLYYYLTTAKYTKFLTAIADAHTSTYPSFNPDIIKNSQIIYPKLGEQQVIAKILSDLDSKIELNQRLNENLGAVLKAVFQRWFVDFEFPNAEGKRYKTSGGKMVYNQKLEKKIPEGWKVDLIGKVTKIVRGASPRPIHDFLQSKGMPWVKISDATSSPSKYIMKTSEHIKIEGVSKSRTVNPETLILSNSATPGLPMIMAITACVHDGWLIFNDYKRITKEFLYCYLLKERKKILTLSNGSVFRNLKTGILKNYPIIIPNPKVVKEFTELSISIDNKILLNMKEIMTLRKIKDSLLPRLMSGKIRVPNTEENVMFSGE